MDGHSCYPERLNFHCFHFQVFSIHIVELTLVFVPNLEIINVMSLIIDLKKDIPQIYYAQITSFRFWMNDITENNTNDEVDMIYFFVLANITFFETCAACAWLVGLKRKGQVSDSSFIQTKTRFLIRPSLQFFLYYSKHGDLDSQRIWR